MITRTEQVSPSLTFTYTQQWDVENRLIAVTNTAALTVTRFYYDGDGTRVKKVESRGVTTITTVYVGAHYEKNVTTGVTTTYYYAGATRVAMRQGGVVSYLHGDHLNSASLATNASGAAVPDSPTRYYPYGSTRSGGSGLPTEYRYTGQRREAGLGGLAQTHRVYPNLSSHVSRALTRDRRLLSHSPRARMTLPGQLAVHTVLSHVRVC